MPKSGQVKEWFILELHGMIRGPLVVVCPIVFILLYYRCSLGVVFKVMKKYLLFFFSRFDPFVQVSGQVKEYLLLELHEIIRVSLIVACPMGFNLLCHLIRQVRVLKLMKKLKFKYFIP